MESTPDYAISGSMSVMGMLRQLRSDQVCERIDWTLQSPIAERTFGVNIKGIPGKPSWWVALVPVSVVIVIVSLYSPHWVAIAGALTFFSLVVFGLANRMR